MATYQLKFLYFQVVNVLYRENDWVYVIAADTRQEGFIPHSYCTLYNSQLGELALNNVKKKLPREECGMGVSTNNISTGSNGITSNNNDDNQDHRAGKCTIVFTLSKM